MSGYAALRLAFVHASYISFHAKRGLTKGGKEAFILHDLPLGRRDALFGQSKLRETTTCRETSLFFAISLAKPANSPATIHVSLSFDSVAR